MTTATTTESPIVMANVVRHPPPLSLYIHLPWCVSKCPYCDFNSHRAPRKIPAMQYVDALLADAETVLPDIWGRRVQTIFLGGGTPSLFPPEAIEKLFGQLRALSLLPPAIEITMEANPDSADAARFAEFAAIGVNRLSIGVQSFDDDSLVLLGRAHNSAAAHRAVAAAECFDNINIDLMHGLPGQNAAAAIADVQTAMDLQPEHLSLYQLTLEPGTPFFRMPPKAMPTADTAAVISDEVSAAAEKGGYQRYEVSAFSQQQRECLHNLNYWQFGDYIGLGAGAHGKITTRGKIVRQSRIKNPQEYMRRALASNAIAESHTVEGQNAAFEFVLNALRLTEGFAIEMFSERTGVNIAMLESVLTRCEEEGLLSRDLRTIWATPQGLRYLNDVLIRFLPDVPVSN